MNSKKPVHQISKKSGMGIGHICLATEFQEISNQGYFPYPALVNALIL